MRQSISSHERTTAALRYLATSRSYEDLKFSVAISPRLKDKSNQNELQNPVVIAR
nr:unnamed protein product [Callosobruchus chinensis]